MKRTITTTFFVFCLLLGMATASAQTVYETRGANGPVFSDKPQPGAKAVELRPLNVIDNTVLTGGASADKSAAQPSPRKAGGDKSGSEKGGGDRDAAVAYRSFAIVFPENDGSVVANTAVFEVRVAAEPALRLSEGHAFSVSINGKPVGQRFTSTEFMIPPEFWGDQLPPPNQRIQLGAAIVDRNGVTVKEAPPIQFQLRHATLLQHPHKPKSELPAKPAAQAKAAMKLLPSDSLNSQPTPEAVPKSVIR